MSLMDIGDIMYGRLKDEPYVVPRMVGGRTIGHQPVGMRISDFVQPANEAASNSPEIAADVNESKAQVAKVLEGGQSNG